MYSRYCRSRVGGSGADPTAMGFSRTVKDELARIMPKRRCCQLAELAGLAYVDGSLNHEGYEVVAGQAGAARKVYVLFKLLYQPKMEVKVRQSVGFGKQPVYTVQIPHQYKLQSIANSLAGVERRFAARRWGKACCRRAFLRGVYLGRGSCTEPSKNYHLEIVTNTFSQAALVQGCAETFGLSPGVVQRKNRVTVYFKDAEEIGQFLGHLGAHTAVLRLENVRVVKAMRNQANRLVNCETANMDKTLEASLRQLENIRLIQDKKGLKALSPELSEIALLRLEHPYATLKELGELSDGNLSKSGVNHRMRKLEKIADDLR